MELEFKSVFLVCLDMQDDINHVLARSYSMKKADELANIAKQYWKNIYITVEKMAVNNPLKNLQLEETITVKKSTDVCICGKNPGGCIGSLSCKCSAISSCKRVTSENPLDFENYSFQQKPTLETAIVDVISIKRGIVEVNIPEWDPDEIIGLSLNEIPTNIRKELVAGIQLMADINLNASKTSDLIFENLRIYEEPAVYDDFDDLDEDQEFMSSDDEDTIGNEKLEEKEKDSKENSEE